MTRLRSIVAWCGVLVACVLGMVFSSGGALGAKDDSIGVGITGIDHLAEHLSVQNFWVDGYNAAQAGQGGRTVCCAMLPPHWRPGLKVNVKWHVTNWRDRTSQAYERVVSVERYEEVGQLWVHFLADGSVRVISSVEGPYSPTYPGPRDEIPNKEPWHKYPWIDDSQ